MYFSISIEMLINDVRFIVVITIMSKICYWDIRYKNIKCQKIIIEFKLLAILIRKPKKKREIRKESIISYSNDRIIALSFSI